MGIVRTAPATLATAPQWLGGFGLMSFEIEQLISHIGVLLQHGPQDSSVTGALLRTSFEYYALEAGIPGDPLQLPYVPYVTQKTWVSNTIQAMHKYKIKISLDFPGLSSWTTNDAYLMQIFLPYVKLPTTLMILNKVRMYLRVVTVSDLLSTDSRTYGINVISGNRNIGHPNPSYYRHAWPQVPPPTHIEKELWTQYLCLALNISHAHPYRPTIHEMSWRKEATTYSKWLYLAKHDQLYQHGGKNTWTLWERDHTTKTRYETRSCGNSYCVKNQTEELPDDCTLTSVQMRGIHAYRLQGHPYKEAARANKSHSMPDHLPKSINPNVHTFLYNIMLQNGSIFSDSSSDNGRATYAVVVQPPTTTCILEDVDMESFIHLSGQVDHSAEDIHSYRAELMGILVAIEYTNTLTLCIQLGDSTGSCTIYCDNKGALQASFGHKRPTPRWSSFDSLTHQAGVVSLTNTMAPLSCQRSSRLVYPIQRLVICCER